MEMQKQTSKSYLNSLQIMYLALLAGQLMFAGICFFLHNSGNFEASNAEIASTFKIIVPIFALGAFIGSRFLLKSKIKVIPHTGTLSEKLIAYRVAFMLSLAVLESASLFSTVIYLLTADTIFLYITIFLMLFFVLQKPDIQKIAEMLQLSNQEKQVLEKPDSIVIK